MRVNFLTNDGDIVNKILRARNHHEKEYIVSVNRIINEIYTKWVMSWNLETKLKIVSKQLGPKFKIILTQGLNRQIRKCMNH